MGPGESVADKAGWGGLSCAESGDDRVVLGRDKREMDRTIFLEVAGQSFFHAWVRASEGQVGCF